MPEHALTNADRAPAGKVGRVVTVVIVALALGLFLAACGGAGQRDVTVPAPPDSVSARPASAASRADGRVTLLNGASVSLSAFHGSPTLLWFVADGCASCAASIPAVAEHLAAFRRARTRILVVGIYGSFGSGAAARTELKSFGREAAGKAFANRTWTWGLASKGLTLAYDPSGLPDEYQLLDSSGHVVYRNSVPVSTMRALLAHLRTRTSRASDANQASTGTTTTATLP
jgi:hypothetical protein